MNYTHIVRGTAFTSRSLKEVAVLKDHLFCIDEQGMIAKVLRPEDVHLVDADIPITTLPEGQFLLPGFIDLHVHAPQWAQSGTALDLPLYDWLNTYTFPLEAKFSDIDFAEKVYTHLVDTLLANGTTTVLYFASIHKEASYKLAEICAKRGQRGLVGKVVMDDAQENPGFYRDASTAEALQDTEEFIVAVKELAKSVKQGVYPVVTPRFIPSCTDEALQGLGELAKKYDTHVQSHCSESDWAHGFVKDRFQKNDASALHDFGLLRDKSVMAHSNFLEDADADLFAETGTAIAHCPISNAYFANSVLPVAHLHEKNVEIGLGTDVSGGFSPSLYDNIRQAVMASRMLEDGVNPDLAPHVRGRQDSRITVNEAFYLATAGGGESLSLPIGRLEEGYCFDAQVIDTTSLPIFDATEPLEDIFQKILYLTRPEHIQQVFVQGECVHKK
ncbi:guanine deaminase [Kurthia gibsonii]|nr:guanine deaminase [Kurthia gibsonii]